MSEREIRALELARILRFGGNQKVRQKKAILWLKRHGVGIQDAPGSYWYTTMTKVRAAQGSEASRG